MYSIIFASSTAWRRGGCSIAQGGGYGACSLAGEGGVGLVGVVVEYGPEQLTCVCQT